MKPAFGWTLLSADALKRAEAHLRSDVAGVRDEIGFLALHQGYADRFFPGTSVLHTRLRYALMVPWLYQDLLKERPRGRVGELLQRKEVALAGRLKQGEPDGVIGGDSYPKPTTQPPSMVYWTALGTWRILKGTPDGGYPRRSWLHRVLGSTAARQRLKDDDDQYLDEAAPLFASIPGAPDDWSEPGEPFDFVLRPSEARFLRDCLLAVQRPGTPGAPSLLTGLLDTRLSRSTDLFSTPVRRAADADDREALVRAQRCAALAALGRGVYAALSEAMREADGVPTSTVHRAHLSEVIEEFGSDALALDIDEAQQDTGGRLNAGFLQVLRETQVWLRDGARDLPRLQPVYERAETRRKGQRARLAQTLNGRERRAEWDPEKHTLAEPLHYRWGNVRRLLLDLQEAP